MLAGVQHAKPEDKVELFEGNFLGKEVVPEAEIGNNHVRQRVRSQSIGQWDP